MTDEGTVYPVGPGHRHSRGPVPETYAETGALDHRCPACGMEAGAYCVHPSGVQRKAPCPRRMAHNPDPEAA